MLSRGPKCLINERRVLQLPVLGVMNVETLFSITVSTEHGTLIFSAMDIHPSLIGKTVLTSIPEFKGYLYENDLI